MHAWNCKLLAEFKAKGAYDCSQKKNCDALEHCHISPLIAKMAGSSSKLVSSPGFCFLAPEGICGAKLSGATSVPVFHDLTSMVYCGVPLTFVLVIDIAAGIGTISLGDPNLPIHLFRSERKVIAFDTSDHTASEVFGAHDQGHKLIIGIRHQQIRSRYGPVVLVAQFVD